MSRLFVRPGTVSQLFLVFMAALAWPLAAAELKVTSSGLSFIALAGRSPEPQQFNAYASPAVTEFSPLVLASTQTGNWLTVSSAAGGSFASGITVIVSVNSSSLPVGSYSGQVTVTQSGLNGSPASIPVSLKVVPLAPYIVAEPESVTVAARPGVDPAPASLAVRNGGTGTLSASFTAMASGTPSGSPAWLALSQPIAGSFRNSSTVGVIIRSASLPAGTYSGVVTVTAAGASNSPLNIPVTLTVGTTGGPTIRVSPPALSFLAGLGANPPQRTLTVNNAGSGTLRPTFTSSTSDGGRWLMVSSPTGGTFGSSSSVVVDIDITGLNKGSYSGGVIVADPSAENSPVRVPVMLVVEDPKPEMRLTGYSFSFWAPVGSYVLLRFLDVNNIGTGLLKWSAVATSEGPTRWLSIRPASGEAVVSSTRVVVDTSELPAGIYQGAVVVTAANVVSGPNPQTVTVTLGVGVPLATMNNAGIVNGASFFSSTVSAGSIVSIFGRDLGPRGGVQAGLVGGKLPTELAGVRVLFDGLAAPLFYASDQQLNVQVPLELAGRESVPVQVVVNNLAGPAIQLNLRPADPGVFLVAGRPAIFLHGSNAQVSSEVQARAGDFLTIYATGLGMLDTPVESGVPAPMTALVRTRALPRVTLGGVSVPVLFSGLAPGFVGLYQINIQVPAGVPSGNSALVLALESAETAPMIVPIR